MNRVFIDMDGVIVDFDELKAALKVTGDELKIMPYAFFNMQPLPGAITGVLSLIAEGYDVFIATKPPTGISWAYADKVSWILRYLPELKRKIILTHDKGLLGDEGDVLIDDRPQKANCEQFKGCLITFTNETTWPSVLERIKSFNAKRNTQTIPVHISAPLKRMDGE